MTEKKKRLTPLESIEAQINASKERLEQLKKREWLSSLFKINTPEN